MSLGENIRRIRQDKGWTQGDLSAVTGIKINHISRLEQDDSDPKASTILKLTKALGCSPTILMTDPKQETTSIDDLMSMVCERIEALPTKAKEDLIKVLDRFCMGWELTRLVTTDKQRQARDGRLETEGQGG